MRTDPTNLHTIKIPQRSKWKAHLLGQNDLVFIPTVDGVPNTFHRFMQRLCFGIIWEKDK